MGIILDLSAYAEETADITMADGNVLHLKKPTELMVIHLLQLKNVDESSDPLVIMTTLNRVAQEILNCNADGVTFDYKTVSELKTDQKAAIVKAYSEWANELRANPTTSSPRSPEKPGRTPRRSLLRRCMPWRNTRG